MKRSTIGLAAFVTFAFTACGWYPLGRDPFFDLDVKSRREAMRTYPLERQWTLYLYDHQRMHPGDLALAEPIAARGEPAARYIVERLAETTNDFDHPAALWVFGTMQRRGYFDICKSAYVSVLRENESRITRRATRTAYRRELARLCEGDR